MIIPALVAKSQEELLSRYNAVKDMGKLFQVDVMDGVFVKSSYLQFEFVLPPGNFEAHLMLQKPYDWILKYGRFFQTIIIHCESDGVSKSIQAVKSLHKKVGLALRPKTSISDIELYIDKIDQILVFTGNKIGEYGSVFDPSQLEKIKYIKKNYPHLPIEVDGGINNVSLSLAREAGASLFVIGSYLQQDKPLTVLLHDLD